MAEKRNLDPARWLGRPGIVVTAAVAFCLVGAGLLLWGRYGAGVFNDTVLAALAWCF